MSKGSKEDRKRRREQEAAGPAAATATTTITTTDAADDKHERKRLKKEAKAKAKAQAEAEAAAAAAAAAAQQPPPTQNDVNGEPANSQSATAVAPIPPKKKDKKDKKRDRAGSGAATEGPGMAAAEAQQTTEEANEKKEKKRKKHKERHHDSHGPENQAEVAVAASTEREDDDAAAKARKKEAKQKKKLATQKKSDKEQAAEEGADAGSRKTDASAAADVMNDEAEKQSKSKSKKKDKKRARDEETTDAAAGDSAAAQEPATQGAGDSSDSPSKPKRKKTGGRVAKPKEPSAKERYKHQTWKPPREAKAKSASETDRISRQRKALAAWAKRHTKRHILVERCFSRMQLGWLTDDIGLTFKRGVFTKQEHETLKKTVDAYKKRNNISHESLLDIIFNAKKTKQQREHQLFFQECAGALVDRANTTVRNHVKTFLHPLWRKGYWTFAELQELKTAFDEVGHDFVTIGDRVGRLSNNARTKWYYLEDLRYKANLGPWSIEEKQKLREAVIHYRKVKPRALLDWNEIAKEVGGNRHPRNYAAMWHCLRGKRLAVRDQDKRQRELEQAGIPYDEAQKQVEREWKEVGSYRDFVSDEMDPEEEAEAVANYPIGEEWLFNGFQGEPGMDVDGWEPLVDDLILLQRLRYQRAARKEQINWDGLGFGQWNWPGDVLKRKLDEIVEKRCPPYFRAKRSWPAILNKVYWDMEKEDFDPGYDPHHDLGKANEATTTATAEASGSAAGGKKSGGDDEDAAKTDSEEDELDDGEMPSDLDDFMDEDEDDSGQKA